MKLVVFGLSLSSSWGNGHATTYRALLREFAARGHRVSFHEWDAPWYGGAHRDLAEPDFCRLALYPSWRKHRPEALGEVRDADAVMVGSYVRDGRALVDDLAATGAALHFYDIDTPVTVAALRAERCEYLRSDQVPVFDRYLSFTGGPFLAEVLEAELRARDARALYCSVDAERYRRAAPQHRFRARLAYMGTYAPDRQEGLERLLLEPARRLPGGAFVVAGPQYPPDSRWPANVRRIQHVAPAEHASYYASADWQLNLTRADMRHVGWSPSVRLFEAAACGAALISDSWPGLEGFLSPGREVLLPEGPEHVVEILESVGEDERRAIGEAARRRILAEHTARRRAEELESLLTTTAPGRAAVA